MSPHDFVLAGLLRALRIIRASELPACTVLLAVSTLLLVGCASNRRPASPTSETPIFDTPDVDSLH